MRKTVSRGLPFATVNLTVSHTYNNAYREVVGLIKKIRKLMKRTGDDKEFKQYIADIRTEFKRKRNFMAMLDKAGLR